MTYFKSCNYCLSEIQHFITCEQCESVYFCGINCKVKSQTINENSHDHSKWCSRMKIYISQENELANFPFTFTKEVTDRDFDAEKLRDFLRKKGVYNHGFWRFISPNPSSNRDKYDAETYVLPSEEDLLESKLNNISLSKLCTWEAYYKWRGFPLDSPIGILLHIPLTIYHIIANLNPYLLDKTDLKIHLVGIQFESSIDIIFKELGFLLPSNAIKLFLIGNDIRRNVIEKAVISENVSIFKHKSYYHECYNDMPRPDLIIGLNAGLSAYQSWKKTIECIKDLRAPCYFTDYNQYSLDNSIELLKSCDAVENRFTCDRGERSSVSPTHQKPCESISNVDNDEAITTTNVREIYEVTMNPFRCALRVYSEQHAMPSYSNAFILKYQ